MIGVLSFVVAQRTQEIGIGMASAPCGVTCCGGCFARECCGS
jgi:hypothetical protein